MEEKPEGTQEIASSIAKWTMVRKTMTVIVSVFFAFSFPLILIVSNRISFFQSNDLMALISDLPLFFIVFLLFISLSVEIAALVFVFIAYVKTKKLVIFPFIALFAILSSLVILPVSYQKAESSYSEQISFSPEKWAAASPYERNDLWPQFIKDHPLIGQSQTMVVGYLGDPNKKNETEDQWFYYLGYGDYAEYSYLKIAFGSDEKVNFYSIYRW